MSRSVVLDYDGTITERDTLRMVLAEFGDHDVVAEADALLHRGEIQLREEIPMQFATVRAPLEDVVAWLLEHLRLRPGFREFAALARPVVLSSGFTS